MKLTLTQCLNFERLYASLKSKVLPVQLTYKFSKLFARALPELEFYYGELNKIISRYAEKDENGNPISHNDNYTIKEEYLARAKKEIDELRKLEVEIPDLYLKIEELKDLELTVEEFQSILPFIED